MAGYCWRTVVDDESSPNTKLQQRSAGNISSRFSAWPFIATILQLLLLAFMVVLVNYYSTQRQSDYDDIEAAMLGRNDDDRLPAEESLDDGKAKSKHKMCECCVRGGQGNSFFCRPSYISYVQTDRQDVVSAVKRRSSRQSSGHPSIPQLAIIYFNVCSFSYIVLQLPVQAILYFKLCSLSDISRQIL